MVGDLKQELKRECELCATLQIWHREIIHRCDAVVFELCSIDARIELSSPLKKEYFHIHTQLFGPALISNLSLPNQSVKTNRNCRSHSVHFEECNCNKGRQLNSVTFNMKDSWSVDC